MEVVLRRISIIVRIILIEHNTSIICDILLKSLFKYHLLQVRVAEKNITL